MERSAPVLEHKRAAASERAADKRRKSADKERARWLVYDGGAEPFDLWAEYLRLQRFAPFSRVRWDRWTLKLRRCRWTPGRSGWCSPSRRIISLSLWPSLDRIELRETLLHEMVHAVVGGVRQGPRWHGPRFRGHLDESARKVFDLPADVRLPTYSGHRYSLDRAIESAMRDMDPDHTVRAAARRAARR